MSVSNGQNADANTFNNAFASKTTDNTLSGVQTLDNAGSATIADAQQQINDNKDNIATNTSDISANQSNISSNSVAISDNLSDIADLRTMTGSVDGQVDMGTFTGGIVTNNTDLTTNLQEIISALALVSSPLIFQGVWNASTNSPALVSSTGTAGHFYIVSVAGSTNLDGITDWSLNDWAVYDGTVWRKIDNSELVTSVNSQSGAVVLDTDDVSEGSTNLYYTEARVSANTSVSANTAKVTNATHTGEVTGSVALTVDSTAISNKSSVTAAASDELLVSDASDSGNLKKVTAQSIADLGAGGSASNNIEYVFIDNTDSPYTVLSTDELILCDTSAGVVQVDLPLTSSSDKRVLRIKKITSDTTTVAVNPNVLDTYNGNTNTTLRTINETIHFVSNGPNNDWVQLDRKTITPITSFTPTGTFTTNTTYTGRWYREGRFAYVNYRIEFSGAPNSTTLILDLPAGLTIDTASILGTDINEDLGIFGAEDSSSVAAQRMMVGRITYNTSTTLAPETLDDGGAAVHATQPVTQIFPFTVASGDVMSGKAKVPILNWEI